MTNIASRGATAAVWPTEPEVITRFPADELLVAGRTDVVRGADVVVEQPQLLEV